MIDYQRGCGPHLSRKNVDSVTMSMYWCKRATMYRVCPPPAAPGPIRCSFTRNGIDTRRARRPRPRVVHRIGGELGVGEKKIGKLVVRALVCVPFDYVIPASGF